MKNTCLEKLKLLKKEAKKDKQINTDGIFSKFTDFQNIMISDLSLVELLWEQDEDKLQNKTIGELYIEHVVENDEIRYEDVLFDGNQMFEMTKEENREWYRSLVLGKLVRYGFADIKIINKISGESGFDAFILEDNNNDVMLFFPCTNLIEKEDYLYDSYPVIETVSKNAKIIDKLTNSKKIHQSQQKQAKELLRKCIKELKPNAKLFVGAFSLGGSLAEYAYLSAYTKYKEALGDLILFNPYHNRLSNKEINLLLESKKVKIFVSEGDSVSTVFNYDGFKDISKPVYINYKEFVSITKEDVDNNESFFNAVAKKFRNDYCDKFINFCNNIQTRKFLVFLIRPVLKKTCKKLEQLKESNLNAIDLLVQTQELMQKVSPIIKRFGFNLSEDEDYTFLENIHYIEYMFTSTHLTYTVDCYKNISFDNCGKVKEIIKLNDEDYKVQYPSFEQITGEVLGSHIKIEKDK